MGARTARSRGSVNERQVTQIVDELRRKHPEATRMCDPRDLELTLALVPGVGVWRVGDLTPTVFALAPDDALLIVTIGRTRESGSPCAVTLSSRTVETER